MKKRTKTRKSFLIIIIIGGFIHLGNSQQSIASKGNGAEKSFEAYTIDGNVEELNTIEYEHRFYVDALNGDDLNSGKSEAQAWKTLAKVSTETYEGGDTILLKCGNTWNEFLEPKGSGSVGLPIVISSFGTGEKPLIDAEGVVSSGNDYSASIRLYNQEYWKIENLKVQNFAANEGSDRKQKYGILINGKNCGTLKGFNISNMEVCKVNGVITERKNGGLAFTITRSKSNEVPSNFDGITIENCYFYDLANCALFTDSEWKNRDFTSTFGETASNDKTNEWYPSYNIVVRNNRIERTAGNGLVIRIADGPLVEHNTFYMCGELTTGNASYPYNCNNALWQFNEASHTVYNNGDVDASGFDSDYFCKNTIIQYNYSHDNDWGSVLVCSNGGIDRAFNDGTIVRYNIFQNDGHHMVRMSGSTTNTHIYNNVFYIGAEQSGMDILWHKSWNAYSDKTFYSNNIFFVDAYNTTYKFEESTNNIFSNNLFYGKSSTNQPNDPFKVTSDPMLMNPGNGDFGLESLDGYKLKEGSPAIGAGKLMTSETISDFFGNEISPGSTIDIGAHQSASLTGISKSLSEQQKFQVFPNPVDGSTTLNIKSEYHGKIQVILLSINGNEISKYEFHKNSELVSRVLDLNSLETGSYIINIVSGESFVSRKIIKI